MKILLVTLIALCGFTSACTTSPSDTPQQTGAVGSGLGGQTIGTPFAGSSGAGSSAVAGPGNGSNASSAPTGH